MSSDHSYLSKLNQDWENQDPDDEDLKDLENFENLSIKWSGRHEKTNTPVQKNLFLNSNLSWVVTAY